MRQRNQHLTRTREAAEREEEDNLEQVLLFFLLH